MVKDIWRVFEYSLAAPYEADDQLKKEINERLYGIPAAERKKRYWADVARAADHAGNMRHRVIAWPKTEGRIIRFLDVFEPSRDEADDIKWYLDRHREPNATV